MSPLKTWAAAALSLTVAATAHAALINRGGGMIYDLSLIHISEPTRPY